MQVVKDFIGSKAECSSVVAPGNVKTLRYDFSFETPGLNLGIPLTIMNPGDILLDAWTVTKTNISTAGPSVLRWDVGTYNPAANFAPNAPNRGILLSSVPGASLGVVPAALSFSSSLDQIDYILTNDAKTSISCAYFDYALSNSTSGYMWCWETKFVETSVLKFVLSQDGFLGGTDVGLTAGSASLYLKISRAPIKK